MNLSTLVCTSLPNLPPLHSTSTTRDNAAENVAIEARNINFSVNTRHGKMVPILKDCSIRIPSRQIRMVLGPNGYGKSTFLKILAGLLTQTSGTLFVQRPKSNVFQNPDHQVVMPTIEADMAFGLGRLNLVTAEVRSGVLKALDAIACLITYRAYNILDESDQIGVIKAIQNLLDISGEVTALWVSHRLEELEYAYGAIYMEDGRAIIHGDATSISKFIKGKQSSYINKLVTKDNTYGCDTLVLVF
ncbi:hypothetical protein CRYUN_Cryun08bG0075200 [Craigia yunnanensis]